MRVILRRLWREERDVTWYLCSFYVLTSDVSMMVERLNMNEGSSRKGKKEEDGGKKKRRETFSRWDIILAFLEIVEIWPARAQRAHPSSEQSNFLQWYSVLWCIVSWEDYWQIWIDGKMDGFIEIKTAGMCHMAVGRLLLLDQWSK